MRAALRAWAASARSWSRSGLGPGIVVARAVAVPVALALILGALLIALMGRDPLAAYVALVDGALGGAGWIHLQATLNRAAMIVGAALAAGLALRSGLLNIGIEGQMVLGGVVAALAALHLPLPAPAALPLVLAGAALAGGLWALLAGMMQLRLGVPLLLGSLLLNYPANHLASWLVSHPFRDLHAGLSASARIPAGLRLPTLGATDVQLAVPVVALLAVALAVFFRRSALGYEARMTGLGPGFARASGIDVDRLGARMVFASGALAGLIGALAVLGEHHRYIDGMLTRPLHAWTGIMAVLLGGTGPAGMVAAGVFFAALTSGAMGMERAAAVPRELARVLLACIILLVAARGRTHLDGGRS